MLILGIGDLQLLGNKHGRRMALLVVKIVFQLLLHERLHFVLLDRLHELLSVISLA